MSQQEHAPGRQSPAVVDVERRGLQKLLTPFDSLSSRDFRWMWFGQVGQASAMWAEQVARNWLIWELTGSGLALGLVNLARAGPLLILGLWAGVAADRFDKRKLLIVMQTGTLLVYVVMAVLIEGGWIRVWHIYLTTVLMSAGTAMNQPVRTSWLPQLVPQGHLMNALSLNAVAINSTRLVGPAAVGVLIAFGGVGMGYIVATAIYGFVIFATSKIQSPLKQAIAGKASMAAQLVEGMRFMAKERLVLALVIMALGPLAFAISYLTLLPVFATEVLGMGSEGFGALLSAQAVGGLTAGLVLASIRKVANKGKLMLITGLSYGVLLLLLGLAHWAVLAFSLIVLVGAAQVIFRTANNTALLQVTPPDIRGRVLSMTLLDTALGPLAAILGGFLTDAINVSVGIAAIGALSLVVVGGIALIEPRIRRL